MKYKCIQAFEYLTEGQVYDAELPASKRGSVRLWDSARGCGTFTAHWRFVEALKRGELVQVN